MPTHKISKIIFCKNRYKKVDLQIFIHKKIAAEIFAAICVKQC